ncbi:glycosyltransferase family 9 protein [Klenkia brasiliensis]|uniref:ADP-heptose:LPS heptosyltransferase n=1 Tax=Klenkia brasiliensis TaxID=333142 RepID=A0A1G7SY33_9ACTN|nr:glycosyltransferase family 9 protein [Klenkia brasiliensis]SDG27762.1 ADP-heptose:LPS heptosyltransferase [Klenkia brasiliensis]
MSRALVVRLDSLGDVVVCGPAVRAVAAGSSSTTVLAGPRSAEVARLLPGVDDVEVFDAPWISAGAGPVDPAAVAGLVDRLRGRFDTALVLTSFHQSALPTALLLRLAGVPRVAAVSTDFPGSLLDVRLSEPADAPEPVRMLQVAAGAGFALPPGDDGRLALVDVLPAVAGLPDRYVVVHPGADAPARSYPPDRWRAVVAALTRAGHAVVVTGGPDERALTSVVAAGHGLDLGARLTVAELAAVLRGADAVAVGNTGPAHLAAAVGTPVVSLFSPVVPALRWAPLTDRRVVLGDQRAACAGSRARVCPLPGHPCLAGVDPAAVVEGVQRLVGVRA